MSVDLNRIHYAVIRSQDKETIRITLSVKDAKRYIGNRYNSYHIERVYLDIYRGRQHRYLITFLDRPSCISIRQAFETKKIERKIMAYPRPVGKETVVTDRHTLTSNRPRSIERMERWEEQLTKQDRVD